MIKERLRAVSADGLLFTILAWYAGHGQVGRITEQFGIGDELFKDCLTTVVEEGILVLSQGDYVSSFGPKCLELKGPDDSTAFFQLERLLGKGRFIIGGVYDAEQLAAELKSSGRDMEISRQVIALRRASIFRTAIDEAITEYLDRDTDQGGSESGQLAQAIATLEIALHRLHCRKLRYL